MKILKPGKVEQRKFVCEKCGCEFVATPGDTEWWGIQVLNCPCGSEMSWDSGEPYEEPMPMQNELPVGMTHRLADMICGRITTDYSKAFECAKTLLENGVTFREG